METLRQRNWKATITDAEGKVVFRFRYPVRSKRRSRDAMMLVLAFAPQGSTVVFDVSTDFNNPDAITYTNTYKIGGDMKRLYAELVALI